MNVDGRLKFIRLGEFEESGKPINDELSGKQTNKKGISKSWRPSAAKFWFFVVVVLPTIITMAYYYTIASDMYVSEASFVVRSPDKEHSTTVMDRMLQGAGGGDQENTLIVKEYILSRDALRSLEKNDHLRMIFNRPEADFLSRFPNFFSGNSFEHLFDAYKRFVDLTINEDSGVATLTTKAFRSGDAQLLATSLIKYGEDLVNRMNQRSEQDTLAVAHREVEGAEAHVTATQEAITMFRNQSKMIDPPASSKEIMLMASKMSGQVAQLKARLSAVKESSPRSPQISILREQIQAIGSQIDAATAKMAGTDGSLTPQVSLYERLELQREFADKELSGATESLISARVNAERQHLYLDRLIEPIQADYPTYPKRLKVVALVFGVSCLTFALCWLLVAGAREHLS